MMIFLQEKGWKKVDKKTVTETEVKALFNYIDKDRSGFISPEVRFFAIF